MNDTKSVKGGHMKIKKAKAVTFNQTKRAIQWIEIRHSIVRSDFRGFVLRDLDIVHLSLCHMQKHKILIMILQKPDKSMESLDNLYRKWYAANQYKIASWIYANTVLEMKSYRNYCSYI